MKTVEWHFSRTELADIYLRNVGLGPIARMAMLGVRRIGKTAFLLNDLGPRAIELGFYPVYINMWANLAAPQEHILNMLDEYLHALQTDTKVSVANLLKSEVKKLDINLGVIKTSVDTATQVIRPAQSQIEAINQKVKQLAELCSANDLRLLFILDEIQHLNSAEAFVPIQSCLRTQFDIFSDICVIFAGSSRGGVAAMFNSDMAKFGNKRLAMPFFNSASQVEFPLLDEKFVAFYHQTLLEQFGIDYDRTQLNHCFDTMDHSPFWFRLLISELIINRIPLDEAMERINARIRLDGGLEATISKMTELDKLVFMRIYQGDGLYSKAALAEYAQVLKRKVNKGSVQNVVRKLKTAGILTEGDNRFYIEKVGLYEIVRTKRYAKVKTGKDR